MTQNYKKGDKVKFKKITKGKDSCEVYHSCGVIEEFDTAGNARVKEEEGISPAVHVVPMLNLMPE